MRYTLLQMTQDILNDMDSDNVNSIDDTFESTQVAQIIKTCFFEMIANRNWPHLKKLMQFDAVTDSGRPNYLTIPDLVKEVEEFRYNKRKLDGDRDLYQLVRWKEPDTFLRYVSNRNSSQPNVQTVTDLNGISLLIYNDRAPEYWTSFDDKYIICDSYDGVIDSVLQRNKTQFTAYLTPGWTHLDSFIPDLPTEAFPALLEEAKSTAFLVLKQMSNPKAEQKATRQQKWLSRKAWTANGGVRYPNYGRKR